MQDASSQPSTREFPCTTCGSAMAFAPGTRALKCSHCGAENIIPEDGSTIPEKDFLAELENLEGQADNFDTLEGQADNFDTLEVQCTNCAAMTTLPDATVAAECPFCGTPIVATAKSQRLIKPAALLPFAITRHQALSAFEKWLHGLWFAPSDLKKRAVTDSRFTGVYLPFWVYDTSATTRYTGERGDDYYTSESYTDSKGKRQTRQVKRTRWRNVSGTVHSKFIDVLVCASVSLPSDLVAPLEPWDLRSKTPYKDEYLSGFRAEAYKIPLKQGFEIAQTIVAPKIDSQIRSHIGGDHQRIHSKNSSWFNIQFQHILLPVWVSSFTYAGQLYQFLVNARTGEVQGKRPYSYWKIAFAILFALILIGTIIAIIAALKH